MGRAYLLQSICADTQRLHHAHFRHSIRQQTSCLRILCTCKHSWRHCCTTTRLDTLTKTGRASHTSSVCLRRARFNPRPGHSSKWESWRTMQLVGGFSRGSHVSPALHSGTAPFGSQDLAKISQLNSRPHTAKREAGGVTNSGVSDQQESGLQYSGEIWTDLNI
ncbi:hypothetical protein PR048_027818 [Dryococelus australis]|uniref:Uncharacterized protein n=1 Tax=Dryococelus australis TaxID=614101 RepID=A0ABQ9GHM1_9NEOP|nr:hypothetical protein PR048_027818 [Dryococelus australis]